MQDDGGTILLMEVGCDLVEQRGHRMDPRLTQAYPAPVPFILNALKEAQLSDAIAEFI